MTNIVEIHEQDDTLFTMSAGGQVRAWTVAIDGSLLETHLHCALRLGPGHIELDE